MSAYGDFVANIGINAMLRPTIFEARYSEAAIRALTAPRPLWVLIAAAVLIGLLNVFATIPPAFIRGDGGSWDFPTGIIGGPNNDLANCLVGYYYQLFSPWKWHFLYAPNLGAPAGVNVFWLDVIPWMCLAGKMLYTATGIVWYPLGAVMALCLVLPGIGITFLFAETGYRSLITAVAGSVLVDCMPYLLNRWGHPPLMLHFLILFALALYLRTARMPKNRLISIVWIALLAVTLMTNIYMSVMIGGVWFASMVRKWATNGDTPGHISAEALVTVLAMIPVVMALWVFELGATGAGSWGFGEWSMNLASPIFPQMSGVLPFLSDYRLGFPRQYEGFAWVGFGTLFILMVGCRAWVDWFRHRAIRHWPLIAVLAGMFIWALSNRVTLGSRILFTVPLSDYVVTHIFGTFRSSGRFFWPVGYAALAFGIILIMRRFKPGAAVAILCVASILQGVDTIPFRAQIYESASHARPASVDRATVAEIVAGARAVEVYPSFLCSWSVGEDHHKRPVDEAERLAQTNMEIQILAAHGNRPINTVNHARLAPDCDAEDARRREPLKANTAYFYLDTMAAGADPLAGRDYAGACGQVGWVRYCLLRS